MDEFWGEPHKRRSALFRGKHFRDEVIVLCLRWYLRYPLSYRDLEEMMLERWPVTGPFDDRPLGHSLRSGPKRTDSIGDAPAEQIVAVR
jgi:hypothetical protein